MLAIAGAAMTRTGALHKLYFRDNPAPGLIRLGIILGMAWIAFVLWRHSDPSVTGIYVWFYLVMGYAAIKLFGQATARGFGARIREDAAERRNLAAALLIASFTLATALIFGGSLWGEADPDGEGEGGWWIPVSFFLLGWITLLVTFMLFLAREGKQFRRRIQRDQSLADARAAATFLLSSAVALTDAVSGDFWGWRHGLLTFGVLALLLIVREWFAERASRGAGDDVAPGDPRRVIESIVYISMGTGAWIINRLLDAALGPG